MLDSFLFRKFYIVLHFLLIIVVNKNVFIVAFTAQSSKTREFMAMNP